MNKDRNMQVSPHGSNTMSDNFLAYLNYLDLEMEKANKFGRQCQWEDNDLEDASRWYSIAEAFKVCKEKAIEMIGNYKK